MQDHSARARCGRSARPKGEPGFTLVELILVIVLIGILASVVSEPLIQGLKAREEVTSDLNAIGKLRYATERIVRELRQVQFISSGTGFQLKPLDYSDPNGNSSPGICFTRVGGATGATLTTVAIRMNAPLLTYDLPGSCTNPISAPTTLADGASSLKFDYYGFIDPNNNNGQVGLGTVLVGDPSFGTKVNVVDVTLTLTTGGGAVLSHRTRVLLQNGVWGAIF